MKDILSEEFLDEFHKKAHEPIRAVPTHLPTLNRICRGSGGGLGFGPIFVTISGATGNGKSALALGFASAALRHGLEGGVCMINLEMSDIQTATRMYAIHSQTRIASLEQGSFNDHAFDTARKAMAGSQPLWVPDGLLVSWESCLAYMDECLMKHGTRYYILDYLQLVSTGTEQEIYARTQKIVTELRAWGVQHQSTILCLSQFNRGTSSNYDQSPRMTGLFGGMILEASSDLVLLLDHSRYRRDGNDAFSYLIVAKNRAGPCIEIPIAWNYRTLSCAEGEPHEEHLWPK